MAEQKDKRNTPSNGIYLSKLSKCDDFFPLKKGEGVSHKVTNNSIQNKHTMNKMT